MSDIVFNDSGAVQMLTKYFKNVVPAGGNNYTLKLFANNITPSDVDVAGDYAEASGGGYAAITLTAANFTISVVSGIAQAAYGTQTFTFSGVLSTTAGPPAGTATIYGYYVVDGDGVLIYAQKAPAPFTPAAAGEAVLVIPVFKLSKGTPT